MPRSIQETISELEKVQEIGKKSATTLAEGGYTLRRLASAIPGDIVQLFVESGGKLSTNKAKIYIANALTALSRSAPPPLRASEFQEEMNKNLFYLKTDCTALNDLVGTGFRNATTVGLAGPQASGKSQIVNELIVQALNLSEDAYVMTFETELNTFSNRRLHQIASAKGVDYDPNRVLLTPAQRIIDVRNQYYQYQNADEIAETEGLDVKLITVDSLTALFQRSFVRRERFGDRKAELGRHLSYLEDMAKKYNAVLVCTCQVYESPLSPSEYGFSSKDAYTHFGTNYIVWGGHILRHTLGTWLSVIRVQGGDDESKNLWSAVLFDSSEMPRGSCTFRISRKGIIDA
ncbi:MAG: hypothetical protein ACYTFW_00980 [Planctomycetota bacterium]|jgi:RecA/RadA recombinase